MRRPDEQAAEERAQAATEGRWENVRGIDGGIVCDIGDEAWDITEDAEFIAHARTDIPMFVERLKEARGKLEALMKAGVTDYSKFTGTNRVDCHFCNGVWRTEEPPKHKTTCPLDRILRGEEKA